MGLILTNLVVMDIKELESGIDPNSHWYFRAKKNFLLKNVPEGCTQSVDIGAGSKYFSHELAKVKTMESVFPIDPNFAVDETETINQCMVISLKTASDQILKSQFWVFMDVIEHIDDDLAFLKHYVEIAPNGSTFFITVPAYKFMWSKHDVFLGHYRRYTLKEIEHLLESNGFKINFSSYMFSFLPIPILINRTLVGKFKPRKSSVLKTVKKEHNSSNYFIKKILNFFLKREI